MIEQIASLLLDGGELIIAFEEDGYDKFLVLAIVDGEDNIKNEVVLGYDEAEELLAVLLDFLTEG